MATGSEAVDRITEVTGIPAATVARLAKILKQAKPPLWQRSGQGGGKSARHVEPFHLTNIALGLAADPITRAPELVSRMRGMVPSASSAPFLPGKTLGDVLDGLVNTLSIPSEKGAFYSKIYIPILRIFSYTQAPAHEVTIEALSLQDRQPGHQPFCRYVAPDRKAVFPNSEVPAGAPHITYAIGPGLLEALADLWADSRAHVTTSFSQSSPSSPASSGSQDGENAEGTPAPSASSDCSSSLDPRQGTEGASHQGRPHGRIATGLAGRCNPILAEREGQERFPCR